MTETANADQAAFWNETLGPVWVELQVLLDKQIGPLGEAAMAALDLREGEHVLDVGCGCGTTSWSLAKRVGPAGGVLGVDLSGPMLAAARTDRPGEPGCRPEFIQADAQTEPFASAAFDAAFSRFGVMFFADPVAAFANIHRSLKPSARLAFVTWRTLRENPMMFAAAEAAAPLIELAKPDPAAPGPFRYADGQTVRRDLEAAGFRDVALKPHDAVVEGADLDTAFALALRMGPVGAALRERPALAEKVKPVVRAALARYTTDGRVRFPAAVWIVTARQ